MADLGSSGWTPSAGWTLERKPQLLGIGTVLYRSHRLVGLLWLQNLWSLIQFCRARVGDTS
jgi:hypothetical protein